MLNIICNLIAPLDKVVIHVYNYYTHVQLMRMRIPKITRGIMARTSAGIDVKLIKTGLVMAKAKGLSGFSVRQLCSKAKVNLGMFHYYFGTKDNFDKVLLSKIYSGMIENINLTVSQKLTPKENVIHILNAITGFVTENRIILSALAGDVLSGNKNIIKHISENYFVHVHILKGEIERGFKQGDLAVENVMEAMIMLVSPLVLPNMLLGMLERFDKNALKTVRESMLTEEFEKNVKKRIKTLINLVFKEK